MNIMTVDTGERPESAMALVTVGWRGVENCMHSPRMDGFNSTCFAGKMYGYMHVASFRYIDIGHDVPWHRSVAHRFKNFFYITS